MIKEKISSLRLGWFDIRETFQSNLYFGKGFFKNSLKGVSLSIFLLFLLILSDYLSRELLNYLSTFPSESIAKGFSDFIYSVNDRFGLKNLDYLSNVVSIGAGVLGVILGLFYTAFVTIIATKYSNINSLISALILEQKAIKKYFIFLAVLTSLAFLFQLTLALGYKPTLISCLAFSVLTIVAISSFISFGRYTLIYFDASHLVNDLLRENYLILSKVIKEKESLEILNNGKKNISRIYNNIRKIQIVIRESNNPQISNTSLDQISNDLLDFSIYYNSIKHTIPSKGGWHLQRRKFKNWDEAREWDFSLLKRTGVSIQPELVDSYNLIEKRIIDAQFEIFDQYLNDSEKVNELVNQSKYLSLSAIQCDFDLFKYFHGKLTDLILQKLQNFKSEDGIFGLQLISLYQNLLVSHLVGFNQNLSLFGIDRLKKLAHSIHNFKNTDQIFEFPYFIRIWLDKYQEKLNEEKHLEGEIVTPVFYTEYELAQLIQHEIQNYIKKIGSYCENELPVLSKKLSNLGLSIEALYLNMEFKEVCQKINLFSNHVEKLIINLNELNFQNHDYPFEFKKQGELIVQIDELDNRINQNIWDLGMSSYEYDMQDIPDIFGAVYQIILEDITDKLLKDEPDVNVITEYLPNFFNYCLLYIEKLRVRYQNTDNIEFSTSKIYPLIIDLFEVSSIAIITAKIQNKEIIINCIFDYWSQLHKNESEEKKFWEWIYLIYSYFNHPFMGMSTHSYIKEHDRVTRFESYLKECEHVEIKQLDRGGLTSLIEYYDTDINDFYVKATVRKLSVDMLSSIKLDEIFIEYFLKGRVSLKDTDIKQTQYGDKLRRIVEEEINQPKV